MFKNRDISLFMDFYEMTMSNGYFENKQGNKDVVFEMFFRKIPDNGGFAIMAGLEQLIEYLNQLAFSNSDLEYLKSKRIFSSEFLKYLETFKFTCDVYSIKEGTPIFPGEPIITVRGPLIEAQLIETMLLMTINHQSLIATKANRMVRAAKGIPVMEFGSRRAQGLEGAVLGARAAYIGGCVGSSCALADKLYKIPATGTMAHSWVQLFDSEYEAFRVYVETYKEKPILLVDTYDVLNSGVPNAIKIFKEMEESFGLRPGGIRIDSGDIAYLSIKSREMLDAAGFKDCKIIASNSLDECIIKDILTQGAKIDAFGVGERLITSKSDPVFGGVYKLMAVEENGVLRPKIKISENVGKITTPCYKKLFRFYDLKTGKAQGDLLALFEETIDESKPYELFDPEYEWKRKVLENYRVEELLMPIFIKGSQVYKSPTVQEIQKYCKEQVDTLWPEVLRIKNPQKYFVDFSLKLWKIKQGLLAEYSENIKNQ